MRQLKLFKVTDSAHRGDLDPGRRKSRRPLSSKKPIHLTLKARKQFRENGRLVVSEAKRLAAHSQVRIYDLALASDHIHFFIQIRTRRDYVSFIRALTGILARRLGKGVYRRSGLATPPFGHTSFLCENFANLY